MNTKPIIPKNKAGTFVNSIVTAAKELATRQTNAIANDRLNAVKCFILFVFNVTTIFSTTLVGHNRTL